MIVTPWQIYWITRLDGIAKFFLLSGLVLLLVGILFFLPWKTHFGQEEFDESRSNLPILFPILFGIFLVIASTLTPSTKEMAAILIVPRIVNNDKVQAVPSRVMDLATEWLDELKPKNGGKR